MKTNKVPCIIINNSTNEWDYIKFHLESWGYKYIQISNRLNDHHDQILVINFNNKLGEVSNFRSDITYSTCQCNRYLAPNIKDFLKEAARLKGYYYVTKEDLKGMLEGYPIEVVQTMINNQVRKGEKACIKTFQDNDIDGFEWSRSPEGSGFWIEVIAKRNFNEYFKRYPKIDINMKREFTKSDLKSGMVVETRRNELYLVVNNLIISKIGFIKLENFRDNLTNKLLKEFDIIKVYKQSNAWGEGLNGELMYEDLLWERKEVTTMSIEEIEQKLNLPSGSLRIKKITLN